MGVSLAHRSINRISMCRTLNEIFPNDCTHRIGGTIPQASTCKTTCKCVCVCVLNEQSLSTNSACTSCRQQWHHLREIDLAVTQGAPPSYNAIKHTHQWHHKQWQKCTQIASTSDPGAESALCSDANLAHPIVAWPFRLREGKSCREVAPKSLGFGWTKPAIFRRHRRTIHVDSKDWRVHGQLLRTNRALTVGLIDWCAWSFIRRQICIVHVPDFLRFWKLWVSHMFRMKFIPVRIYYALNFWNHFNNMHAFVLL